MIQVYRLGAGFFNSYLAGSDPGWILVDSGRRARARALTRRLVRIGLDPHEIRLMIVTHAHYDHVRGLTAIRALTGAKILVHEAEAGDLETATTSAVRGTNAFTRWEVRFLARHASGLLPYKPVKSDIAVDGVFDLASFGIAGRVVPTPGHSAGSLSVILDSGEAFVGDTCFGARLPLFGSVLPPFADDLEALARSWAVLLESGARVFYPGHGPAFGRAALERSLARLKRRLAKFGA